MCEKPSLHMDPVHLTLDVTPNRALFTFSWTRSIVKPRSSYVRGLCFYFRVLSIIGRFCLLAVFYRDRFQLKESMNVIVVGSFLKVDRFDHPARSTLMNLWHELKLARPWPS